MSNFYCLPGRAGGSPIVLVLQDRDITRLEQRNAYLEGELKLQGAASPPLISLDFTRPDVHNFNNS
jgi:hypothetical protein